MKGDYLAEESSISIELFALNQFDIAFTVGKKFLDDSLRMSPTNNLSMLRYSKDITNVKVCHVNDPQKCSKCEHRWLGYYAHSEWTAMVFFNEGPIPSAKNISPEGNRSKNILRVIASTVLSS